MGFFRRRGEKFVQNSKRMINYEQASSTWDAIKQLAGGLNPRSVRRGRVETFQSAYERLGLTEETLAKVYQNYFLKLYLSMVVGVGGTALTALYLAQGSSWAAVLAYLGFAAVCVSQMFSASFRMYQIRRRQLCDVKEWLKRRSEWLPLSVELPPAPKSKGTSLMKRP